jgi:hypothetical protein
LLLAAVLACAPALALANQDATLVLKNGERVSGQLTYTGGANLDINVAGAPRSIPLNDIAIVAFVSGDPPLAELNLVPSRDDEAELQRHMIVMRNGSVVRGKMYKFSPTGDVVTIDTAPGQRQDISSSQIARLYLAGGAARSVYANTINGAAPQSVPQPVGTAGVSAPGTLTVNANQAWTDTGLTVKKGDRVVFQTTGQVAIAPGANAGPDGFAGDTGARNAYPVSASPAGALIGRVGGGAAFPIGANTQPITMPANGRLYLGINDSNFTDNSGAFTVQLQFTR